MIIPPFIGYVSGFVELSDRSHDIEYIYIVPYLLWYQDQLIHCKCFPFKDALHKLNKEQLFYHLSQSSNSLKGWIVVMLILSETLQKLRS